MTGDVENAGLDRLLSQEPIGIDVLLAPHHGSKRANPLLLRDWASPDIVIQSGGLPGTETHVRNTYPQSKIYTTRESGTITASIAEDGQIIVTPFRR